MDPAAISSLLARQDGVVSAAQALAAGMSRSAIDRRVQSGAWRRVGTGVYLRADHPTSPAVTLRAAVLSAGESACAFGPSAAWWHGLIDRAPAVAWVSVPGGRRIASAPGVRIRRRTLDSSDTDSVRALRVTSLALTVLDASVLMDGGAQMLDRALQRRVSLPILERVHREHGVRRGGGAVSALITTAAVGGASEAERMLVRLLRSAKLTGWALHVRSCGYEIDAAFEAERVAIEVDGWAWHRSAERFQGDAVRQNALINAGWHVLRFTWHRLADDPDGVLREIRIALNRECKKGG